MFSILFYFIFLFLSLRIRNGRPSFRYHRGRICKTAYELCMPTQVFIKVIPGFNHQSSVCQVAPNSKPQQGQVLVGADNNALLCFDLESKITTVDPIAFPINRKASYDSVWIYGSCNGLLDLSITVESHENKTAVLFIYKLFH